MYHLLHSRMVTSSRCRATAGRPAAAHTCRAVPRLAMYSAAPVIATRPPPCRRARSASACSPSAATLSSTE
eukprot:585408-Prorocentrum_minimum.AAC.1